jgi:hypothetical protein
MKLAVVIQHHPDGYVIKNPTDFFDRIKTGKRLTKEEFEQRIEEGKETGKRITREEQVPESWKHPCKKYSGFVCGLEVDITISAEADTEEELLAILKAKTIERSYAFEKAKNDWPQVYKIVEIEI